MARSTVMEERLFDEISDYPYAVIAYVGGDGYPLNVATSFNIDVDRGVIALDRPAVPAPPGAGTEVNVTFSHVRPYPGVGYDQRRYVSIWGTLEAAGDRLELRPERSHGWDEERMSFFELCERSVPAAHAYMQKLAEERGVPVKARVSVGWLIFLATRLPFLTATVVPVLLGALVARAQGSSAWWYVVLALVGACAIHLGLNVANDVADARSGADDANVNPTMFSGGSRVIQYGLVSLRAMTITSVALYGVGIAIGLFLTATRGAELLWIGVAGILISIFYTAPPLRLVHRGLGEVCVALGFGPLMVLGTYFVAAQRFSGEALYASLPVGLLIMLVLYANQVPDRPADERAGKRTLVVRLPKDEIVMGYGFSAAAAFALVIAGAASGLLPVWSLITLATMPLALRVYRALGSHYESPYELMAALGVNVGLHFAFGMLLNLAYLLEILV